MANGRHENKRKFYCTNVHLRIIETLITSMYQLSAVTAAVTNWKWNQASGNYSTYEQELLVGMPVLSSQA